MKYGPMVNVLYDMTNLLAQSTGLTIPYFAPYVGVGVGYQWAHLSGFTASGSTGFPSVASNDTYGAIAYQFILGGAVPNPLGARLGDDRRISLLRHGITQSKCGDPGRL